MTTSCHYHPAHKAPPHLCFKRRRRMARKSPKLSSRACRGNLVNLNALYMAMKWIRILEDISFIFIGYKMGDVPAAGELQHGD